jgi:glutathione synthase/RimK-type ligase-like ATP-grasp enzyme
MNKLGVLSSNVKTHFMKRLTEEVNQELVIINPWIGASSIDFSTILVRTSGVHRDDLDLQYLRQHPHLEIINPLYSLEVFRSKNAQFDFFHSHDLPHLPWKDLSLGILPPEFIDWGQGRDLLVKPRRGFGGWGIKRLSTAEFHEWWKNQREVGDVDYLVQPYVHGAREFRVFFAGDFRFTMERLKGDKATANFRTGGDAHKSELPVSEFKVVEHLIQLSGAHYGAIDLFLINNDLYILELNVVPGIEQVEALSGRSMIKGILRNH